MDNFEIYERLRDVIAEYAGVSREEVTREVDLQSDLGLSSLQIIILLASIEDEFNIHIDTNDLSSVSSIDGFADLIASYLKNDKDAKD